MRQILITRSIARAIAWDAGNRRMREGGRIAWNLDDYNYCIETFNRLWPEEETANGTLDRSRHHQGTE